MSTVRRVVGPLLDHVFDVLPSLLLFALVLSANRLEIEFVQHLT